MSRLLVALRIREVDLSIGPARVLFLEISSLQAY
jgi:hypothetical protein